MADDSVCPKRRRLGSLIDRLSIKGVIEEKRNTDQECLDPFVNRQGWWKNREKIITVKPKEPDRKTKVYVLRRSSHLTSGSYLQCGNCNGLSFKLFRVNPSPSRHGSSSDIKSLQLCRRCWSEHTSLQKDTALVKHCSLQSRGPLGITEDRVLDGWRLLCRDWAKRVPDCHPASRGADCQCASCEEPVLTPLVKVISGHQCTLNKPSPKPYLFNADGHVLPRNDIPKHMLQDLASTTNNSRAGPATLNMIDRFLQEQPSDIYPTRNHGTGEDAVKLDHDYMENVQKEIVVPSVALPVKKVNKPIVNSMIHKPTTSKSTESKRWIVDTKKTAKNIYGNGAKPTGEKRSPKDVPKTKPNEETADGSRLGIKCPICQRLILKSYSCWRKMNAPQQFHHLFRNGVEIVRACRRCIPYRKPKHSTLTANDNAMKEAVKKSLLSLAATKKAKEQQLRQSRMGTPTKLNGKASVDGVRQKASNVSASASPKPRTNALASVKNISPSPVTIARVNVTAINVGKKTSNRTHIAANNNEAKSHVDDAMATNNNNNNDVVEKKTGSGRNDVTFDSDSIRFQTGLKSLRSGKIVIFDLNKVRGEDCQDIDGNVVADVKHRLQHVN